MQTAKAPYTISVNSHPIQSPRRSGAKDGAEVSFLGIVRGIEKGRSIEGIDYSSYGGMELKILGKIAETAIDRFESHEAVILHRLGFVKAGDASILISVSSKHSGTAFEVCRYLLDQIKATAPIWKHPVFSTAQSNQE